MEKEFYSFNSLEKLNARFLEILQGKTSFSEEELSLAVKSFIQKLKIGDKYKPEGKLKANTVLIRATEVWFSLERDYGLNKVTIRYLFIYLFIYEYLL